MKITYRCPKCFNEVSRLIQVDPENPMGVDTSDPFCVKCLEKIELAFIKDLKRKKALGTYRKHTWYTRAAYFDFQGISSNVKSLLI